MKLRNFWVKTKVEDRATEVATGGRSGTVTIYVNDNGESKPALDIIMGVGAKDGKLYVEARAYAAYWRPGMAALKIDLGRED